MEYNKEEFTAVRNEDGSILLTPKHREPEPGDVFRYDDGNIIMFHTLKRYVWLTGTWSYSEFNTNSTCAFSGNREDFTYIGKGNDVISVSY